MISSIDHTKEALNRLISIYKGATNITKFVKSFQLVNDNIENLFRSILINIDIDKASSSDLDVLGQIIGLPRPQLEAFLNPVFVYNKKDASSITGNDGAFDTGYYTIVTDPNSKSSIPMPDSDYRRILNAKIHLNYYGGSVDNIMVAIGELCTDNPHIEYNGTNVLSPHFLVYKAFTPLENVIFQSSYPSAKSSATHRINTIFDTYIYPKSLGIWYTIGDINATEFVYSPDGKEYGQLKGRNAEDVKFTKGGGFDDGKVTNSTRGVYWSGKT